MKDQGEPENSMRNELAEGIFNVYIETMNKHSSYFNMYPEEIPRIVLLSMMLACREVICSIFLLPGISLDVKDTMNAFCSTLKDEVRMKMKRVAQ